MTAPYTIEVRPHGALNCLMVCDGDKPIAAIGIPWELVVVVANAVETGAADVARLPRAIHKPLAVEIAQRSRPIGSPSAHRLTAALAALESA